MTYKAYDWITENGSRATPVFNILGSVQLVVCLLSIPMCKSPLLYVPRTPLTFPDIFGKRIRSWTHRIDFMGKFKLR
jgi:hypothetical protein